jgi:hypothetical protein
VFNQAGGGLASDLIQNKVTYDEAPDPLGAWRFVNFGTNASDLSLAGDGADPDGDECLNIIEYAFNTDPLAGDSAVSAGALLVRTNGQTHVAVQFPVVSAASDITYRVEASGDLQTWLPGCTYSGTNRVTATAHTTEFSRTGAGLESLIVRDNTPVASAPQRFLRLQIAKP